MDLSKVNWEWLKQNAPNTYKAFLNFYKEIIDNKK